MIAACIYFSIDGRINHKKEPKEKTMCEKCLKARMLFSICFIYNSTDTKGSILQSSHTEYPSEASGNIRIYRNKPCKEGQKTQTTQK